MLLSIIAQLDKHLTTQRPKTTDIFPVIEMNAEKDYDKGGRRHDDRI